jgi:phage-related protein
MADEPKLTVRFYRNGAGHEPVRVWLKSLTRATMTEIGADIQRVQWRWPVSKPLVDGLGNGLYEVRTKYENVQYRVLFCIKASAMVLLHGFVKKTRTAPTDIALGRERKSEVDKE